MFIKKPQYWSVTYTNLYFFLFGNPRTARIYGISLYKNHHNYVIGFSASKHILLDKSISLTPRIAFSDLILCKINPSRENKLDMAQRSIT